MTCEGEGLSYGELDRGPTGWRITCIAAGVAPGDAGGPLPRAVARDGGGDPRRAQGRRRLRAARSRLSAGAAGLHAGGQPGAGADRPGVAGRRPAGARPRHPGDPARPRPRADRSARAPTIRGSRSRRAIRPTSSTPRARPASPRAWWCAHGNVARLFAATERWFGFGAEDVWTLFHSYAFDFSVWELWGALLYGGRLVVVPYWVSRSPEAFYDLLATRAGDGAQPDAVGVPPAASGPRSRRRRRAPELRPALRDLRRRGAGAGEPARPGSSATAIERPRLVNMYGITETTVHVTYRPVGWRGRRRGAGSVIGVPIPDLGLYVLDAAARAAAGGRAGRDLRRRRRPRARLPRPAGADGGALRARSVRRAGRAALPHRRPGALAGRRRRWSTWGGSTTR